MSYCIAKDYQCFPSFLTLEKASLIEDESVSPAASSCFIVVLEMCAFLFIYISKEVLLYYSTLLHPDFVPKYSRNSE